MKRCIWMKKFEGEFPHKAGFYAGGIYYIIILLGTIYLLSSEEIEVQKFIPLGVLYLIGLIIFCFKYFKYLKEGHSKKCAFRRSVLELIFVYKSAG